MIFPTGKWKGDIVKIMFDNNSFVGIYIDTYNRKEYNQRYSKKT